MKTQKVSFKNKQGQLLSGRIDFPGTQHPHNFVLFAHCFTCGKNLLALNTISRAMTSNGFAVMRFDFTGLGESEGDFEDTTFSGNVEDLVAASEYLATHHSAPSLLVGHSLGGAAVLLAATRLLSVKAVATLGAPSEPSHVKRLLRSSLAEIREQGVAKVEIAGREFSIKESFLKDLEAQNVVNILKKGRKPLLILHSPQDATVEIKNAEILYKAAHHPKSFISLDGADHLLSRREDSDYAGRMIAQWAYRYLPIPKEEQPRTKHQVVASLDADEGFTTAMKVGRHYLLSDEPEAMGGNDFGPSPYEFLSAGLAACTAMTLHMYARRKGWDLSHVEVHTSYSKSHAEDCKACESEDAKIDTFKRSIAIQGELDEKQQRRLLEIADKCPVHKTLHSTTQILTHRLE